MVRVIRLATYYNYFQKKKKIQNQLVGGQGSKAVNKENKGISKERNFTERTYLTNKEIGMLPLAKMPRAPT